MKPFDLQAAIAGAPIKRINGDVLKFIAYAPNAEREQKVIVMSSAGNILVYPVTTSSIVMASVLKTYWVNVYAGKTGAPYFGVPFDNEADAAKNWNFMDKYIKTISFDIEE
jgi:hypothetical protein